MLQKPKEKDIGATPIRIREATNADIQFIFNSWLKSARASIGREMTSTVYYSEMHKVVERLLKSCKVHVACDEANIDDIYGYGVQEMVDGIFVLHFIYVKHTYRNLGIGTLILNSFNYNPEYASVYTFHTPAATRLAAKYRMLHNPFVALTPDYRQPLDVAPPTAETVRNLEAQDERA